MAGRCKAQKPSRSDVVLGDEEQMQITSQIRTQFDSMAPKRPMKPSRSESDSSPQLPLPPEFSSEDTIPELYKLRSLQSQSHVLPLGDGDSLVQEEYVETQYFKELDSIEKRHHKTGSGFIQVGNEGVENGHDHVEIVTGFYGGRGMVRRGYRSNPATNDWLPRVDGELIFNSHKPNRSEGS